MMLTVVIPAKDEVDNIAYVLDRLKPVEEVIVVIPRDDGTVGVCESYENVRVVIHSVPGKGEAMRRGFFEATQPYVLAMDADGSMRPEEIDRAYDLLVKNGGLVKGSRYLGSSVDLTWYRSTGNKMLTMIFNVLYGTRFTDLCYGYIGFSMSILDTLDLRAVGFEIESEMVARAARIHAHISEFASSEDHRIHGESNLRPIRDGFRILFQIVRHRFYG